MLKIDLNSIEKESFMVHPHTIAGETCFLVQPIHVGAKWTKDNLIFRSSVWNSNGELVSASFKKFFNWGEQPDLCYTPFSLTANGGCNLVEKIDGSTLIVSKYKGELIVRTRGTVDAAKLDNGYEIELLKQKYPKVFSHALLNVGVSILFEWTTPTNKIVIDYGNEPQLFLVGMICHNDYSMYPQAILDLEAQNMNVSRPQRFNFASIKEMLEGVDAFKGQEGLCVYCNHDQDIRKVKSAAYLAAHRLKSELGSFDKLVDFYFTCGCPDYLAFKDKIEQLTDFELFNQIQGDVSRIAGGIKETKKISDSMGHFVTPLRSITRKEAAEKIFQAYGKTNRASMAFKLLDGKILDDDDVKKLLYQTLKN